MCRGEQGRDLHVFAALASCTINTPSIEKTELEAFVIPVLGPACPLSTPQSLASLSKSF